MKQCQTHCPICAGMIDWHKGYGLESRCCDKECHDEFNWRYSLSIMDKPYYPQPGSRWDATDTDGEEAVNVKDRLQQFADKAMPRNEDDQATMF